mgnify:CR=1 FL=1
MKLLSQDKTLVNAVYALLDGRAEVPSSKSGLGLGRGLGPIAAIRPQTWDRLRMILAQAATRWFSKHGGWQSLHGLRQDAPSSASVTGSAQEMTRPARGPIWDRRAPTELGLHFSKASWDAITSIAGFSSTRKRAPRKNSRKSAVLKTGDQWLGVLFYDQLQQPTTVSEVPFPAINQLWVDNALLHWIEPSSHRLFSSGHWGNIEEWLDGHRAGYLESLGQEAFWRWHRWAAIQHIREADNEPESTLEWWAAISASLESHGREDLALFLIGAFESDAGGLPRQDGQLRSVVRTMLRWNTEKRSVRFVDAQYERTQIWNETWARFSNCRTNR